MLRTNLDTFTSNGNTMPLNDIIQWVHRKNTFRKPFGISYRPNDRNGIDMYFETNSAELMNEILIQWPTAVVENIQHN